MSSNNTRQGLLLAISAYVLWAIAPIYFKFLDHVEPMVILSHRIFWSFMLTVVIIFCVRQWPKVWEALKSKTVMTALMVSTLLIGANWGIFIWAVNSGNMLSASLGYYINPLLNILLGVLFFHERLNSRQLFATLLCVAAVGYEIWSFGEIPWVAVALASSFALYGLVRKKIAIDSFTGMALETGFLLPFALGYLFFTQGPWFGLDLNGLALNATLFFAGPVTMLPLLCFAAAANRISMRSLGFLQYIGPSGMFVLAIFVYGEAFDVNKLVTFVIIWSALIILVWDGVRMQKNTRIAKNLSLAK